MSPTERRIESTLLRRAEVLTRLSHDYELWRRAAEALQARTPSGRPVIPGLAPVTFGEWLSVAFNGSLRRMTVLAQNDASATVAITARGMTAIALRADEAVTSLRPYHDEHRGLVAALYDAIHFGAAPYKGPHRMMTFEEWLRAGAAALLGHDGQPARSASTSAI
jgi:hypothetical protein